MKSKICLAAVTLFAMFSCSGLFTPVPNEPMEVATPVSLPTVAEEPAEQNEDAMYLAKIVYGYNATNCSERLQKAIMWCVINRVEDKQYANTIKEVCLQEDQWQGFSDDNPVVLPTYNIALDVLNKWQQGTWRPISTDILYIDRTHTGLIMRASWVGGNVWTIEEDTNA